MKNIDEINDNINELILSKSFDKLSVEEKEKAITYVGGEEDYNALRTTLLAITTSFNTEEDIAIDQELKSDLMNQFEKKFGASGGRVKIIPLYRQPFFQLAVAASVALLIFFAFPFFNPSNKNQGQLAMNTTDKEANISPEGTIDEKIIPDLALEHDTNIPAAEKAISSKLDEADGLKEDKVGEDEGPLRTANTITPLLDKNKNDEILASEETKNESAKDIDSKSKLSSTVVNNGTNNNEKANDDFLFERVMRERKEAEMNKGKKKNKDKFEDLAKNDVPNNVSKKSEIDQKVLEAAAGLTNTESTPMAPGKIAITTSVSAFVEENKTEILDLLFTTF